MTIGPISRASLGMAIGLGCATPPPPPASPLASVPGRYAVVAARYVEPGSSPNWEVGAPHPIPAINMTLYFPHGLVEETAVTVGEREVVFIGDIVIRHPSLDWDEEAADKTQRRTFDKLHPHEEEASSSNWIQVMSGWLDPTWRDSVFREYELDRGDAAWGRFLDHSRNKFAATGWEDLFPNPVGAGASDELPASEIRAQYELLRDSRRFVSHCTNFPGPLRVSDQAHAYRLTLAHPDADKHFKELLRSEGLPGQMYGLAGVYFTDPDQLPELIAPYLERAEPIASLGGDIQVYTEIKDVAEWIESGFTPKRLRHGSCD